MTWHFIPAPSNWTILEIGLVQDFANHQITQQDKTNLLELSFRNHHQKSSKPPWPPPLQPPLTYPSLSHSPSSLLHTTTITTSKSPSSKSPLQIPTLRIQAMGDQLGEFGARDPFPAEIESAFAEKVLGNVDTEHKILIPTVSALSLSQQECTPISPLQDPMSKDDAQKLFKKVLGWRLLDEEVGLKLQCLWKLRDFKCGVELVNRIYKVTESCGHFPDVHLEQNQVRAELWTESLGGLSMTDFIVAAKIDEIKTSDLVPRKRVWA
ncbi:probable pterin-4-alpha-carbinolamine dehydratase, chloroplastic [Populus trichocarpa]|uniref:4a-hydroxytetrahydrobiopterin dehydratase n=2 Tax=Populus trichocarpa TaxID=3694 RepID=A0A2K1XLE2_POPTR|nr:probable pterin-4-alpha-carbinolamine dehydratase, chloroplastic [Populus trichocarpa]|eukprot:XP_002322316.3 probable pterin-4-alpha-carbinolamine dehydratase, chloroplastic [Populus trichocarpa]